MRERHEVDAPLYKPAFYSNRIIGPLQHTVSLDTRDFIFHARETDSSILACSARHWKCLAGTRREMCNCIRK